jgi:hypothetical protein
VCKMPERDEIKSESEIIYICKFKSQIN